MPGHNPITDKVTVKQIIRLQPKRIVDVGVGHGNYGAIVAGCFTTKCYKLIGIEIYEPYIIRYRPILEDTYDKIIIGDVRKVIKQKRIRGDMIIFGDILEHLPKKDVHKVMAEAVKKFKFIIVNAPIGWQPQEESVVKIWGNKYEKHLCGLTKKDFLRYNIVEYNEFTPEHKMFNLLIKGEKNGN